MGPGGEPVGGSFWEAVGGRPTFEKLVRALLRGRRATTSCCGRCTPRKTSKGAIQRLTGFLEQYWGGPTHLQRGTRPPAAPHAAPALRGHPRHARPLAAPHARRGRQPRALPAARGDAVGLPRARRPRDGEHGRRCRPPHPPASVEPPHHRRGIIHAGSCRRHHHRRGARRASSPPPNSWRPASAS